MDDFSNINEEEQRDILNEAYLYITKGRYPDGCETDRKRTICRKAKKFTVNRNGELFCRKKKGKKVGYTHCHRTHEHSTSKGWWWLRLSRHLCCHSTLQWGGSCRLRVWTELDEKSLLQSIWYPDLTLVPIKENTEEKNNPCSLPTAYRNWLSFRPVIFLQKIFA